MSEALKCLIVNDGIICLVDENIANDMEDIDTEHVSIGIDNNNLVVNIKDKCLIPVPYDYVDYLIENRNITVYPFGLDYMEPPVIMLKLSRDALIEARALLKFHQQNQD